MAAPQNFYEALTPLRAHRDGFDERFYAPAPDDWVLAVTDVEGSTKAVEAGRYQLVNMSGAASIAAVKNVCRGQEIPFLFGGDGAAILVPPERFPDAREALAATCTFAASAYGMTLRAGALSVGEIRRAGADVRVARYEPSPGNAFGLFLGGGVQLVERALKGREPALPAAGVAIPPGPDDAMPDLGGLSCRWSPLESTRGKIVAVIVTGAADPAAIHDHIIRIADPENLGLDAVRPTNLQAKWPPRTLMIEARARCRGKNGRRGWLWLSAAALLLETLFAWAVFKRDKPIGGFDPTRYKAEMAQNTDFAKYDDTLAMVIDCPEDRIPAIRAWLDAPCARGELSYGIHVSDVALMTCLVESPTANRHVHFVDGGEGGYCQAAKEMKNRMTQSAPDALVRIVEAVA